jgi:N-acetylglucosamine kinase-like BadF-type ATPase
MTEQESKSFDCVQTMRQIRDQISQEIEHMDHQAIVHWLRSRPYSDPLLKRLAERVRDNEIVRNSSRTGQPAAPTNPNAGAQ